MKTLILPVKRKWFDLIKSGEKKFEFRLQNDYWERRLLGSRDRYGMIVVTLGYPKKTDASKRLVFKYKGWMEQKIISSEFGPNPVDVFAIPLIPFDAVEQ